MNYFQLIGLIAGIILPFWNIPLIVRIQKRKSSQDISLYWALGVWICMLLMLPSALISEDSVFKIFWIGNISIFTLVVFQVLRFR